jgi:TPR repeat protein
MKLTLKYSLAAVILVLSFAAPAAADPFTNGSAAYERGDYTTAMNWFLELTDERQIATEAVKLRHLAAEGNAAAQFVLGLMYEDGKGDVLQNNNEAMKWYRLAADQGFGMAQYDIGYMYTLGRGVPRNYVVAHMWLNLSAATDNAAAAELRDNVAKLMNPAQIAEAQKLAREWKPTTQMVR